MGAPLGSYEAGTIPERCIKGNSQLTVVLCFGMGDGFRQINADTKLGDNWAYKFHAQKS